MSKKPNNRFLSIREIISKTHISKKTNSSLDLNQIINGVNTLDKANCYEISFCNNHKYLSQLEKTNSGLVFISQEVKESYEKKHTTIKPNFLVSNNPRFDFDKVIDFFHPPKKAKIHSSVSIKKTAKIGKNCRIEAGVVIGNYVEIGDNAHIYPNVVIYDNVTIGQNVIIHSGSVIGSDGFGFELVNNKAHKQPQIGKVIIGNNVEIGANCAIDRGSIGDTVIEDEVKMDNLVHIAHNVKIGSQTAIMGSCGIAGGAQIGKRCQIYGMVAINGYISIADGVCVHGHSTVTKSIRIPKSIWASTTREQEVKSWAKNTIYLTRLTELFERVKKLEQASELKNKG